MDFFFRVGACILASGQEKSESNWARISLSNASAFLFLIGFGVPVGGGRSGPARTTIFLLISLEFSCPYPGWLCGRSLFPRFGLFCARVLFRNFLVLLGDAPSNPNVNSHSEWSRESGLLFLLVLLLFVFLVRLVLCLATNFWLVLCRFLILFPSCPGLARGRVAGIGLYGPKTDG